MEKDNTFGGFEAVFANITGSKEGKITDPEEIIVKTEDPIVEPPVIEDDPIEDPIEDPTEDPTEDPIEDPVEDPEEDPVEDPIEPKKKDKKEKDPVEQIEELGDAEEEIAEFVQEKIYEKFGFEMGEEKFTSIDDITEFVQAMVEENSKPEFATDEVKAIDEYVRSGGDLKAYMDTVYGGTDLDSIDIDNEKHQKEIVAEDLRTKGYSETRIKRALDRYEDTGTLKEEAEDALESLKEYNEGVSQKLLEEQQKEQRKQVEKQQKYVMGVETAISELDNIRGIEITAAEKKQLINYIFKPTSDGMSQYQKDYLKNNKNLIESAYFTMKGDAFINKVQKKANSTAAKKLQAKLANKGKRAKDQSTQQPSSSASSSIWGSISRQLVKNPIN